MKVATILPQNYLHLTTNDDYFMCLGHLIGAPGMGAYTDFFRERSNEGKFVIMDNGVIEGNQRPIGELCQKAWSIGAREMILTDVFCDKDKTLAAIERDMEILKGCPHPRVMMVPQGDSIDEWVECACEIIRRYGIADITIGVPKVLVKIGGRDARGIAISKLVEECPIAKHATYHLLGCWTTPLEITMLDKLSKNDDFPNIRGVDSAIPFVYARANKLITCDDRPDSEPINFHHTKVSGLKLLYNIYQWRKAGDCTRRYF